jgi:polyhydroxyalkanoate synthesis regulator phasin
LYVIAKDTDALNKIHAMTEKGKDAVNNFVSEKITDAEGNELQFVDKMVLKMHEAKEELERKIEEVVAATYSKLHIAHTDELIKINEKLDALSKELSLANSRIKELEAK